MKNYKSELFYGDVEVGDIFETASRTITDSDIFQFAGLTGDFNELHTSDVYASKTRFGHRIAHGMLTLAIANGLYMRLGCFHSVFLEVKDWKFLKPVMINDTIRLKMTLKEKHLTSNPRKGIFTWQYDVLNQRDELVAAGIIVRMMNNPVDADKKAV
ncbi:MAG: hypothetical protein LKE33_02120 [Acidaminococcus sp.]|nr:hypothetical protein [Acidaminococcus sp.]MCI2100791.1 hypothetical protein [Acidaminococcus sp.]MCI2115112.1 hypothetical protein [Acidaminococcus sp.]MCI2117188.1 hypothetical protein [Acidaminococcus sp.]